MQVLWPEVSFPRSHHPVQGRKAGKQNRGNLSHKATFYCSFHLHPSCCLSSDILPLLSLLHTPFNKIFVVVTVGETRACASIGLAAAVHISSTNKINSGLCSEKRNPTSSGQWTCISSMIIVTQINVLAAHEWKIFLNTLTRAWPWTCSAMENPGWLLSN